MVQFPRGASSLDVTPIEHHHISDLEDWWIQTVFVCVLTHPLASLFEGFLGSLVNCVHPVSVNRRCRVERSDSRRVARGGIESVVRIEGRLAGCRGERVVVCKCNTGLK